MKVGGHEMVRSQIVRYFNSAHLLQKVLVSHWNNIINYHGESV